MAQKSNFIVRGGGDFSGLYKEFNKAQKQMSSFQSTAGKIMRGIGITLSGLAVGKLIKDSTQVAMGVESAMDNISRNMGESSKAFNTWAQTQSKSLGMARADAYKYGSTFSNLLSSFTSNSEDTANKTQELMKAAAIISSKTGRTYDDTANRIRSGMLGSTEAIEDLGVYTNISMIQSTEAFKKFAGNKSWAQLDFQTQQQIRLAAILEQTYARYGDTLADTTQTRQAQFVASLKNIQLSLGQAFLPIYNFILPALTALADAVGKIMSSFARFTQTLFGKKETATNAKDRVKSNTAISNSFNDVAKSAKNATTSVAGFDEINQLGNKGINIEAPDLTELTDAVKGIFDEINKVEPVEGESPLALKIKKMLTVSPETIGELNSSWDNLKKAIRELQITYNDMPTVKWGNEVFKKLFGEFNFKYTAEQFQKNLIDELTHIKDSVIKLTIPIKVVGALMSGDKEKIISAFTEYLNNTPIDKAIFNWWVKSVMPWFEYDKWHNLALEGYLGIGGALLTWQEGNWKERINKWWSESVSPYFTSEKWHQMALSGYLGIGGAFATWQEGDWSNRINTWWNQFVAPYFTSEKWQKLSKTGYLGLSGMLFTWSKEDWKKGMDNWINNYVKPYFTSNKWADMAKNAWITLQNGFADVINSIIDMFNKIQFKLPDWLGGKNWGINIPRIETIPTIPQLATGGVITSPTLAMVGEYAGANSNPEIVAPSDLLRRIIREESGNGNFDMSEIVSLLGSLIDVVKQGKVIAIDGNELISIVNKGQSDSFRSLGKTVIPI